MNGERSALPASLRRSALEPSGVFLLSTIGGVLGGLATSLLAKGVFEGIVIGLLSAIFLELVLESYRRALYEEKLGFLLKAEFDRDFRLCQARLRC